jgi:hypothetical protein
MTWSSRGCTAESLQTDQHGSRMAGDYLEKIIQIPITVPSLGQEDTEAYLAAR